MNSTSKDYLCLGLTIISSLFLAWGIVMAYFDFSVLLLLLVIVVAIIWSSLLRDLRQRWART